MRGTEGNFKNSGELSPLATCGFFVGGKRGRGSSAHTIHQKQTLNDGLSLYQFFYKLSTNFFRRFVFGVNDHFSQLMIGWVLNEVVIQLE